MDKIELIKKIAELKNELNDKIIIPAHHYQDYDIIRFGDVIGDSYKLAVECSKAKSKYIVFCGVLFMAETARILCSKDQTVLIPDPMAGCPMASMASIETVTKAYNKISDKTVKNISPVVYMNSYADLKSFCGEKDGSVCTSSNASKIVEYYFKKNIPVLFFPDYYLGINTAIKMGLKENEIATVKRNLKIEYKNNINEVKIFLWDGFCPVHQRFTESDIKHLRKKYPEINIIVHPECKEEIVKDADISGSTEKIYKTIKDSPKGSVWGIGTETTFVERLVKEFPDKTIMPLKESKCINMVKITLQKLHDSLLSIKNLDNDGKLKYEVTVNENYYVNAKKALQKMIDISG